MSFRVRVGPFTVGKSGLRLSTWGKAGGASVPVVKTGKRGSSFGQARVGPMRWHINPGKWWRELKEAFTQGAEEADRKR